MNQSIFASVDDHSIHIQHLAHDSPKGAVVCLHGAYSSGRAFYSKDFQKGLAPFLHGAGFEVFVPDFRGHGASKPLVSPDSSYGMSEIINREIPAIFERVRETSDSKEIHWVTHSDGGVLITSALARHPEISKSSKSLTLIGTKRVINAKNIKRYLMVDLLWYRLGPLILRTFGYMPAVRLGLGSDNDTRAFSEERRGWLKGDPWVDPNDGFDYASSWKNDLPILAFAAENDDFLGNKSDCADFLVELGRSRSELKVMGIKQGRKADYNHLTLLTHRKAATDHFPEIVDFLKA